MSHQLTIDVPDEMYEPLTRMAEKTGRTLETLAVDWLESSLARALNDPLQPFIGILHSDVPDAADNHDYYIGDALMTALSESPTAVDNAA